MKKIILNFIVLSIFLVNALSAQVYTDNSVNNAVSNGVRYDIIDQSPTSAQSGTEPTARIGYLYPNPANERCNLVILRNIDRVKIGIFAFTGALLKDFEPQRVYQGQVIPIDLRAFRPGNYYFLIRTTEGTEKHLLMIIKTMLDLKVK